jgi:hypothetical protein
MWANIFSCVLLTCGIWVVALNWACAAASHRLQRPLIRRDVCAVPVVAQIFVCAAATVSSYTASPLLPGWLFWLVAFADLALLQILCWPIVSLRREYASRSSDHARNASSTLVK